MAQIVCGVEKLEHQRIEMAYGVMVNESNGVKWREKRRIMKMARNNVKAAKRKMKMLKAELKIRKKKIKMKHGGENAK